MTKHKAGKKQNIKIAFGIGVLASVIVMFLLLIVSTVCIENEYLTMDESTFLSMFIQFLGCCLGGVVVGAIGDGDKKISVAVVGCVVFALQFVIGLLAYDGFPNGIWRLLVATVLAAGVGYLLVVVREKRGIRRRRPKTLR